MGKDRISGLRGRDAHEHLFHWGSHLLSLTRRKIKLLLEPRTCKGC